MNGLNLFSTMMLTNIHVTGRINNKRVQLLQSPSITIDHHPHHHQHYRILEHLSTNFRRAPS